MENIFNFEESDENYLFELPKEYNSMEAGIEIVTEKIEEKRVTYDMDKNEVYLIEPRHTTESHEQILEENFSSNYISGYSIENIRDEHLEYNDRGKYLINDYIEDFTGSINTQGNKSILENIESEDRYNIENSRLNTGLDIQLKELHLFDTRYGQKSESTSTVIEKNSDFIFDKYLLDNNDSGHLLDSISIDSFTNESNGELKNISPDLAIERFYYNEPLYFKNEEQLYKVEDDQNNDPYGISMVYDEPEVIKMMPFIDDTISSLNRSSFIQLDSNNPTNKLINSKLHDVGVSKHSDVNKTPKREEFNYQNSIISTSPLIENKTDFAVQNQENDHQSSVGNSSIENKANILCDRLENQLNYKLKKKEAELSNSLENHALPQHSSYFDKISEITTAVVKIKVKPHRDLSAGSIAIDNKDLNRSLNYKNKNNSSNSNITAVSSDKNESEPQLRNFLSIKQFYDNIQNENASNHQIKSSQTIKRSNEIIFEEIFDKNDQDHTRMNNLNKPAEGASNSQTQPVDSSIVKQHSKIIPFEKLPNSFKNNIFIIKDRKNKEK